jgi:RHS repeat-associated protein
VSYSLDPVGNRLSQTSSLHNVPTVGFTYGPDDTLLNETYDGDGNVTATGSKTFSYDSQNELISANGGAVTIVYDGFGNRVSKTANGVTTKYLVEDDVNPTGYPQVFDELTGSTVTRTYTYGLQRISENQPIDNVWTPSFYGYDGFGTVRQLTNSTGAVTDTWEYDAFGNSYHIDGSTLNNYLFRGEQWDPDLSLYYLRARYYNPVTGRLLSRGPEDGFSQDPPSLHKYLYAEGDPVDMIDPTGRAGEGVLKPTWGGALGEYTGLVDFIVTTTVTVAATIDTACVLDLASSALGGPPLYGICAKRRSTCTCTAKCTEHVVSTPNHANTGVYFTGSGTANSCSEAQVAARKNAEAGMAPGSHAQHCSFRCEQ